MPSPGSRSRSRSPVGRSSLPAASDEGKMMLTGGYAAAAADTPIGAWPNWGGPDFQAAWASVDLTAFAWMLIALYGSVIFDFLRHRDATWEEFQMCVNMINDDFDEDDEGTHPLSGFEEPSITHEILQISAETVRRAHYFKREMPKNPEAFRAMYHSCAQSFVLPPFVEGHDAYSCGDKVCEMCGASAEFDAQLNNSSESWAFVCGECFGKCGKSFPQVGMGCAQRLIKRPDHVMDPRSEADTAKAKADPAESEADTAKAKADPAESESESESESDDLEEYITVRVYAGGIVNTTCAGTLALF